MALHSQGGDTTQRLSDFDRELNQRLLDRELAVDVEVTPSVVKNGGGEFARLVPSNPAAKRAFHELALKLRDPEFLPHSRRFIHLNHHGQDLLVDKRHVLPPEQPTSTDPSQSSSTDTDSALHEQVGSQLDIQFTGHFLFDLAVLPTDFRRGWVIGSGRAYLPNLGVDILLSLDGKRDCVRGVHARLFHHRETRVLMLKATSGEQHLAINADKIDNNGRVVSGTTQSVEIGNLTYVLRSELDGGEKAQYSQTLDNLLAANPGYSSSVLRSLDPTPSANHYHLGHYSIQTPQAAGTFGTVSAAVDLNTGSVYAVKKLTRTTYNFKSVAQELGIMEQLGYHPHICTLHEVLYSDGDLLGMGNRMANEVFVILAPLATRTLAEFIKGSEGRPLRLKALHQTAQGLRYIHSHGIIHRDVKPSNLLITTPFRVIVADFGHSTTERTSKDHMKGTIAYLPPEIINLKNANNAGGYWSPASDVFAYGVVAYEVLHAPFVRRRNNFINESLLESLHHTLRKSHDEADHLLSNTLNAIPSDRPSMRDVCLSNIWLEPETEVKPGKRKHRSS